MVLASIITKRGNTKQAQFCCENCARNYCVSKAWISWWEVIGCPGQVVDSAENFTSDVEEYHAGKLRALFEIGTRRGEPSNYIFNPDLPGL